MQIRCVKKEDLPVCLSIIRESFATVATEFCLTPENCPTHTSFMSMEKLERHFDWGWKMFLLETEDGPVGFYGFSEEDQGVFELHNLAVLPQARHAGWGTKLLNDAKARVRAAGGVGIHIGIIEEHSVLKAWYMRNGFEPVGKKRFFHLPFTAGYLIWKAE